MWKEADQDIRNIIIKTIALQEQTRRDQLEGRKDMVSFCGRSLP